MPHEQPTAQPRRSVRKLARLGMIVGIVLLVMGMGVGGFAYVKAQAAKETALSYIGHLAAGDKQKACAMYTFADAQSCSELVESWQRNFAGAHSFAIQSTSWDGWTGFFTLGFTMEISYVKGTGRGLMELTVFPDKERPAWTPIEAF